jgi:hypothetical protein
MPIISHFAAVEGLRKNQSVTALMKKKDLKDKQYHPYPLLRAKK